MLITISGASGVGKTKVSELLSERLGYTWVNAGRIFREQAESLGLSLGSYAEQAERNQSIDQAMDQYLINTIQSAKDMVVEARLAGAWADKLGVSAMKIYLMADFQVRLDRILNREGEMWRYFTVMKEIKERDASEKRRYKQFYSLDPHDRFLYSLVIDTSNLTVEEIVDQIEAGVKWLESTE